MLTSSSRLGQGESGSQPEEPLEKLLRILVGGEPLPTQRDFVFSPERVKAYIGLVGCAKTTTLCASVMVPAMLYPGSRWLVTRATGWTLEETTFRSFLEMCERLGKGTIVKSRAEPIIRLWIASAREERRGKPAEPSEIIFHAVDDIQKLGSTEFDGIAVDEASEVDETTIMTLNTRLRHRRPKWSGEPEGSHGPYFLNIVANPTSRSHWLYRKFSGASDQPEPMGMLFKPQPRENEQNLPPGYYEEISVGMTQEMKIRLIHGEWGPDPRGQGVFSQEFSTAYHVGKLKPLAGMPMIRAWDFGRRRPAVVWAQVTPEGWVNRLHADMGDNIPLEQWIENVLRLSALKFSMASGWSDFCDPHGEARRDDGQSSCDVMRKHGLQPKSRDVAVERGVDLMSKGLATLVRGRPKSMFDVDGCKTLIEGYSGGYIWAPTRPGHELKREPWKDGFYEHLMDADRYLEVNLALGSTVKAENHKRILRRIRRAATGY